MCLLSKFNSVPENEDIVYIEREHFYVKEATGIHIEDGAPDRWYVGYGIKVTNKKELAFNFNGVVLQLCNIDYFLSNKSIDFTPRIKNYVKMVKINE